MSRLTVEIERIVLDGLILEPAKGRRLVDLTQIALERLLRARGVSGRLGERGQAQEQEAATPGAGMRSSPAATKSSPADETRWANELAEILYRAIDRRA